MKKKKKEKKHLNIYLSKTCLAEVFEAIPAKSGIFETLHTLFSSEASTQQALLRA